MQFRILGPLEIVDDAGAPVELGGPKQRAVLTILLVERGRVVPVDRLIERLWGDEPPSSAVGSLQAYVSNLRRALEPDRSAGAKASVLVTQAPGYRLDVADDDLDVVRYERLLAEGEAAIERGDVVAATTALTTARGLWRGPALAEVAYESFAQGEVERLEELRLAGLEAWAEADLQAGRHAAAVGELESLVMAHPLRSRLRRQLMLALYRSGRQADALRVYKEGRAVLRDELGVEPDADLQALEERILLQSPDLDWRPPARPSAHPPTESRSESDFGRESASVSEDRDAAAPLVGRDRELAALDKALIESASGRGRIVLLAGEPGIGKTRVAEAVAARAAARGSLVGWSRSFEADGAPAFWPWVQVVRAIADQVDDAELVSAAGTGNSEIGRLVPELSDRLGVGGNEPSGGRFAVYDAVSRLLVGLAAARPVVVVLDDAQWADAASLRLLDYVAGEIRSARVLVVAAFRDAEVGDALGATLATLAPLPHAERVVIGGLPEGDVGRVVAGVLDREPDAALVRLVAARTGGNPFFVRELVRLIDTGAATTEVPPTVREVIDRRLARLDDNVRTLLSAAAVAGREFDVRVAAEVASLSEDDALDAIDDAVAARLVDEGDTIGRYRFAHALVQEAIEATLSRTRRARLHAALADVLLPRAEAGRPDLLPEVAHHALEGALPGREDAAIALAARAASVAIAGLAFEEAATSCERALALLGSRPRDDLRYDLQLALGWARRDAGDDVAGRAALSGALDTARRLDDPERFARATLGLSGSVWWGWWTELGVLDRDAVVALEEAVGRLPDAPSQRRAEVLGRLASQLYFDPSQRERREALSLEALAMARALGDDRTIAVALIHRHAAIWEPGRPAERFDLALELTEIGRRLRLPATQLLGHQLQATAAVERNDGADFEAQYAAADELARRVPPHLRVHQEWMESMVTLLRGDIGRGEAVVTTAFESTSRWDAEEATRTWASHVGQLRYDQGRYDELIEPLRSLAATQEVAVAWQSGLVLMLAAGGRLDEARTEWATLQTIAEPPDHSNLSWLFNVSLRAEAAYLLDDRAAAAELLPRLVPMLGLNIVLFTRALYGGPVSLCVGSLEACLGRWDDAVTHLEQAVDETSSLGARSWRARALLRLGETLTRRSGGPASSGERAGAVLAEARSEAETLGMADVARRAGGTADATRAAPVSRGG